MITDYKMLARSSLQKRQGVVPAIQRTGRVLKALPRSQLPPRTDVVRVRIPDLEWSIENVEGKRCAIVQHIPVSSHALPSSPYLSPSQRFLELSTIFL